MTTDTTVSDLIINKLTYSQWKAAKDGGTLSDTETYDLTDKDTAFVHTTGNETVAGEKTFTSMPTVSHDAAGLRLKNPNITKGTSPSSNKYGYVELLDKNGPGNANRIGLFEITQKPNGQSVITIAAYKDVAGSEDRLEFNLVCNQDGTGSAYCPTPPASDDSNKIATTEWVNDNAVTLSDLSTVHVVVDTYVNGSSWYRIYDDGWVEQGGVINSVTANTYTSATVTFLKPFINTNYTVLITQNDDGQQLGISSSTGAESVHTKSTTNFVIASNAWTYGRNWYACGMGA